MKTTPTEFVNWSGKLPDTFMSKVRWVTKKRHYWI